MLQELSMVEQRHLAIREVLDDGAVVTDVALVEPVRVVEDGDARCPSSRRPPPPVAG